MEGRNDCAELYVYGNTRWFIIIIFIIIIHRGGLPVPLARCSRCNYNYTELVRSTSVQPLKRSLAPFPQKDSLFTSICRLNSYRLHIPIYIYSLMIISTAFLRCRITHVFLCTCNCYRVCYVAYPRVACLCNSCGTFFGCITADIYRVFLKVTSKSNQQGGYNITR